MSIGPVYFAPQYKEDASSLVLLRRARDEAEAGALRLAKRSTRQAAFIAQLLAAGCVPPHLEAQARALAIPPEEVEAKDWADGTSPTPADNGDEAA
ncbi:MAG: hypothetical protein AB7E47_02220 [Desulfovibrionaceae bacterium]